MDSLFVDTNIVLDLLSKREDFYLPAAQLFSLADTNKVKLAISSLTIANSNYVLSKKYGNIKARKILRDFKLLVKVLPMDDKILNLALNSDFKDFEDAIQYHSAVENKYKIIVTRNQKDFKLSKISVMSAKAYLSMN